MRTQSVDTSARSRGPWRSTQRAASLAISVVLPTPVGPTSATTPPPSIQRSPTVSMRRASIASARRCASASSQPLRQLRSPVRRRDRARGRALSAAAAAPSGSARDATDRSTRASRAASRACGAGCAALRSASASVSRLDLRCGPDAAWQCAVGAAPGVVARPSGCAIRSVAHGLGVLRPARCSAVDVVVDRSDDLDAAADAAARKNHRIRALRFAHLAQRLCACRQHGSV